MTGRLARTDTEEVARLKAELADLRNVLNSVQREHAEQVQVAEARMWRSLDALNHGVALFDPSDRLVRCNARFEQPFVDNPAFGPGLLHSDLLTLFLQSGLVMTDGLTDAEWHAMMLARWTAPEPPEVVVQLTNGRAVQCIDRRDAAGNMISLSNDVSQLTRVQHELRAAQHRAEAANEAKSAFLANMSHEIRTPMNGVVGMADLLSEMDLNDEQKLFVSTIKSSGEALLLIINDVLDFSKLEADRMVLHAEPFDLEGTLHDLILLMQPAACKNGIELLLDYDMFLPAHLIGDQGRIRQVLTNLLGNAVKFTEQGYVLIRVVGIEMEENQVSVHITVEDTGIGIPEEACDHVFGTFNQVENNTHRAIGGTGLGLSISRRLIEMMDGEIWVESEVGKGSCFGVKMVLPVVTDKIVPVQVLPDRLKRALIVDDLEVNRQILEKQLRVLGVEPVACDTGAKALAQLDDSIDLVLTDFLMPEMDGLELTRHIRASGSNVPIVLISSNHMRIQDAAAAAGVQAVLKNPVPRNVLFAKLAELGAQNSGIAAPALKSTVAPLLPRGTSGARRMRILTAEDNMTNQLLFEKSIRALDVDLRFAKNGVEALSLFEAFCPDLIFMDISMPQMDGRQAVAEIRARERRTGGRVPIFAMTAHSVEEAEEAQLTLGMDGCLTKPMRKHEIIGTIRAWQPDDTGYLEVPQDEDKIA